MSNNKKGKSLRKILTTAYAAVLIGASGMVIADTLFISKSLAKFSNETNTATGNSASGTGTSGNSSSSSSGGASTTPTVTTATAYEDDTKSISIETYE